MIAKILIFDYFLKDLLGLQATFAWQSNYTEHEILIHRDRIQIRPRELRLLTLIYFVHVKQSRTVQKRGSKL